MKLLTFLITLFFAISAFAGDKSITLSVKGMTCNDCANTVEKALKGVKGVKEAKVDLHSNSATVMFASNETSSTDVLVKAVSDAGFTASEGIAAINKEEVKKSKSTKDEDCCEGECKEMKKETKMKKHGKVKSDSKKL